MREHPPNRDDLPNGRGDEAAIAVELLGPEEGDEYSSALVSTVAAALGLEPECLPPLAESIDPDLVESFLSSGLASRTTHGLLSFEYHGYEIRLNSDGVVSIAPAYPLAEDAGSH